MESPLKGRGIPRLETTAVYVSAYMDRLLKVDETDFRFEAVHYFYLSWTDSTAWEQMQNQTYQMLTNSSYKCDFFCSNIWEKVMCCDEFYLPSLLFKNAYGFPQDREIAYNIYPTSDGSVLWEVRVHGLYYQPMDFRHFPFDSFDLSLELRFTDPTILVDTTWLWGSSHPGVKVVPSSGGKKIYTIGRGDDTSSWAVTDYALDAYSVDMGTWYSEFSDLSSDANDPMPLSPLNADQSGGYVDESGTPLNVFSGVDQQMIAVMCTIERFWRPSFINAVLPVLLVAILGLFSFFTSQRALDVRLEIVVTLFLALTAVQFVVIGQIPTSSYVVPTQQLVLATYFFLFLLAIESIAVYHIVCRYEKQQEARRRREAWRRYCKLRDQGKLKNGQNPSLAEAETALPGQLEIVERHQADGTTAGGSEKLEEAVPVANTGHDGKGWCCGFQCAACFGGKPEEDHGDIGTLVSPAGSRRHSGFGIPFFHASKAAREAPFKRSATTPFSSQMTADEALGQYIGHWVDIVFAILLAVGYTISAVLIFVLQSGYIDLFDTPDQVSR